MDKLSNTGGLIALILVILAFVVERFNKWSDGKARAEAERMAQDARRETVEARADVERVTVERDVAVLRAKPWVERVRAALRRTDRGVPK